MNVPLFILPPILILGGILSVVAGGGLGILLVTVISFFLPIHDAIVLTSILALATQTMKIVSFHGFIQWKIVLWYALPGVPASMLAGVLLFILPPRVPQLGIGFLALLFVMLHIFRVRPRLPATRSMVMMTGLGNGIISGLLGGTAIVRNAALLSMGLTKEAFVGTSAMCAILLNVGRLTAYLPRQTWSPVFLHIAVVSVPSILLGVFLGRRLLSLMSQEVFERLLLCVILVGGIKLLFFP